MGVKYRKSGTVALDPLTPWMLLAYVVLQIGGAAYVSWKLDEIPRAVEAGLTPGVVWSATLVSILGFFILVMPAVLLGMFITAKIMKFELPGGAYLRAGSIAAAPTVVLALRLALPPNPVLLGILVLATIPIAFYIAMNLFELTIGETFLSSVFCIPLAIVAFVIVGLLMGLTVVGGAMTNKLTAKLPPGLTTPGTAQRPSQTTPHVQQPDIDPLTSRLNSLQREADSMAAEATTRTTREQFTGRLTTLQDQLENLRSAKGTTDQWKHVKDVLDQLEAKAKQLPSEKPGEEIYRPPAASQSWADTNPAGQEASFGPFNLTLPADAKLDLKSTETAQAWTYKRGATLSLRWVEPADTRQRRPWVVPAWLASRAASKALMLESDSGESTSGTIADVPFTRAEASQKIGYAGLVDGKWLMATIQSYSDAEARSELESAFRTLRKRPAGEAAIDPFATDKLVLRLADDPQQAKVLLKRKGGDIESSLIGAVKSDNRQLRTEAGKLLAEVATDKSLPALRELAAGDDRELAPLARAALQRLAPREFDDVALALIDLKDTNTFKRRDALKKLATAKPDANRPDVTGAIESAVLEAGFFVSDEHIAAMITWATPETVTKILPWLDEDAGINQRRAAMKILAATKDKRAVFPIVRWLIKEPENVVKALIEMGPVAEDEVVKVLREPKTDAAARKNAARILQEIGGTKSVAALQRAAADQRDAGARQAAQIALETVRERVKASKPTTAATTRP